MSEVKANQLILDNGCSLYHNAKHFVPMGRYSATGLKMAMDTVAGDIVVAEYKTVADEKEREKDRRKFSKRLDSLSPEYVRGPWRNREVNGNTFSNIFECIINRQVIS